MNDDLKPVTVLISSSIKSGKMETAIFELETVIKKVTEKESDCEGIQVYKDPNDLQRLLIIEKWKSKEIFLGPHMQMPHMIEFMKIAQSFLDGEPEFTFWQELLSTT